MKITTRDLSLPFLILLAALLLGAASGCGPEGAPSPSASFSGPASRLAFVGQPVDFTAGAPLKTPVRVAVQDANGNTVTDSSLPISLAVTQGTGVSGAKLLGPSSVGAVKGVATFNNLSLEKAGPGYTLTAASGSLTPAVSQSFSVLAGAPAGLVFTAQPSGGVAGSPLPGQPVVTVVDKNGNPVADYQGSVTLSFTYGSTRPGAEISGKSTVPVVNGSARFTDISIAQTYPQFNLTATSDSLSAANSRQFEIVSAPAVKLEFTIQPGGAKAGQPFETQPKVGVEDTYGNVVNVSTATVTVSITPGSGTAGARLSGAQAIVASGGLGGLAVYSNLSIDRPGSGYTLTAASNGVTTAVSQAFDVAAP
jgi:hypothetical protein